MRLLKILITLMFFAGFALAQVSESPVEQPVVEFVNLDFLAPCEHSYRGGLGFYGSREVKTGTNLAARFKTFLRPYLTENGVVEIDLRCRTLIVSDRLDNVRRLADFIKSMDREDMSVEQIIGEPRPAWLVEYDEMKARNPSLYEETAKDPPN